MRRGHGRRTAPPPTQTHQRARGRAGVLPRARETDGNRRRRTQGAEASGRQRRRSRRSAPQRASPRRARRRPATRRPRWLWLWPWLVTWFTARRAAARLTPAAPTRAGRARQRSPPTAGHARRQQGEGAARSGRSARSGATATADGRGQGKRGRRHAQRHAGGRARDERRGGRTPERRTTPRGRANRHTNGFFAQKQDFAKPKGKILCIFS